MRKPRRFEVARSNWSGTAADTSYLKPSYLPETARSTRGASPNAEPRLRTFPSTTTGSATAPEITLGLCSRETPKAPRDRPSQT